MMWFLQMAQLSTTMSMKGGVNTNALRLCQGGRWLTPCPEGNCVPLRIINVLLAIVFEFQRVKLIKDRVGPYLLDFEARLVLVLALLLSLGLWLINVHRVSHNEGGLKGADLEKSSGDDGGGQEDERRAQAKALDS